MSYQKIEINGVKIHYDLQGQGPALVLIHAGIANLTMWDSQISPFSGQFRVLRYDVRGFGETPDPTGDYTDHDDLAGLLKSRGIDHAHILGISNGGRIAIDFALVYPAMVNKLVLVAPGLGGFQVPSDPWYEEMHTKIDALREAGELESAAELETQVWVDGPYRKALDLDPAFRQRAYKLVLHTIRLGIGEGVGDIAQPPAAERLNEIQQNTLLIMGREDMPFMGSIADVLESGIPNLLRVNMLNTAHLPNMEKPDEFNQIVLEFLNE